MKSQDVINKTRDLTEEKVLEMARAAGFRGFENYEETEALAPSNVEVWKRRMWYFARACLMTERCGPLISEDGTSLIEGE